MAHILKTGLWASCRKYPRTTGFNDEFNDEPV